ncbi:hypothetical protein [Mycobacteroides chelonae]|uniref:hypothetical protein n=1 Tax=Mycobacteroides chelonae TaxID=1774 RepID=UPI0012FFA37D|nr:hypothetical protein [Mycobacteroides chelonae]
MKPVTGSDTTTGAIFVHVVEYFVMDELQVVVTHGLVYHRALEKEPVDGDVHSDGPSSLPVAWFV